ncbi:MAG: leucine-rich repeat domain-containing protein, partial [Bacteroidales bacterium]|nr:leucine-rich repeat domain-containing protein [Bacteroidales bacterium]
YSYGRNGYYYTECGCCYYSENGKVGFSMFCNCASLTSIVLPKSVTDIGGHAFSGCVNLRSIVVPDGVTTIGDRAFSDCRNLRSAIIGKSVAKMGMDVFSGCMNLEEFAVSQENLNYQTTNGVLFNKERSFLSAFFDMKQTVYNIPESVAVIGNAAFADCMNLTSVTIPMSVVKIGKRAFFNCSGLTEIHLNGLLPPVCEGDCFDNVPVNCKLYVPKGAYGAYWAASVWGRFVNIIEE